MEERLSASGGEILAGIRSGVATVTLNRPQALNALTLGMLDALTDWFDAWERDERVRMILLRGAGEKAFCAGGDIRALHDAFKAHAEVHRFFEVEYTLDERIYGYPKPVVALIDGVVMGGGMGLAQGARLRLVGERTKMAMPETSIGLFPDVGGSYFLSRLPGKLGVYLGLVGPTLRAADAIYCGLADQYVGIAPMGEPELANLRPAIERHFGQASIEAIVASLEGERDPAYADWARKSLERLAKSSPTMLKVTLEQVRRGASLDLAGCFRMERSLIRASFEQGDFIEGIRALIIEKDNAPRWKPPTLGEVQPASVERFFSRTLSA
jgi:enoyl-CoA hydratase/carnithine racemase